MKNFRDYLKESEEAADTPVAGDNFAINIREECLIESVVIESRSDGVVIAADQRMMQLLESYGYSFEESELTESHFAVGDRVQCRKSGMKGRVVKLDKEHGAEDDQYYTVKRDDGTLKKMAPEDMTKLDEQVMRLDHDRPEPDPGEYDYEGDMAKNELYTMIRSARRLIGMLDNDDNMPEWTQKKINKATDYVDTAADYISSQKERGVMEGDSESNPVARATLHRIMMRHPGMLAQHGPEKVMAAVDDVADLVGDMDDIGTSDISGWVNMVQEILDSQDQGVAEGSLHEDLQADDGERYRSADDFFGQFEADHFDDTQESEDGMEIRGYIDGVNVMVWRFNSPRKTSGYGVYDDSGLSEAGVAEGVDDVKNIDPNELAGSTMGSIAGYMAGDALGGPMVGFGAAGVGGAIGGALAKEELEKSMAEAEYQGRKVQLGKPMAGDVKKSKVYVKNPQGRVVKVNFGQKGMKIKKSIPGRRKNFRARHNCDNPGPRHKARYWSCRAW